MTDLWLTLVNSVNAALGEVHVMTAWEALAVVLAMAYLLLAMKASVWCWAAAFTSTAIYTVLFWKVALLMESMLNIYYMGMALYGYWLWTQGGDKHQGVKVTTWPLKTHLKLIAATALVSLGIGHGMATFTQASSLSRCCDHLFCGDDHLFSRQKSVGELAVLGRYRSGVDLPLLE